MLESYLISINVNKFKIMESSSRLACKMGTMSFRKEKSLCLSVMADYPDNIRYQIKIRSIPEK